MAPVLSPKLDVKLPSGWVQQPNPGGPLSYTPAIGDSAGVLQVSQMTARDFSLIVAQPQLGPFAATAGARLEGWGDNLSSRDASCAMGRLGIASFPRGLLMFTVSERAAYMWTWLGGEPGSAEMKSALEVALGAVESKPPPNAAANAFIAQLDAESLARSELLKGSDPKQLHLALFLDPDGAISGAERPVLSGSISSIQADAKALRFEARFDADATQLVRLSIAPSSKVQKSWLQGLFGRGDKDLGDARGVQVAIERDPGAPVSQAARLWIAQLWALIGEAIAAPYARVSFEAVVLGAGLVKGRAPTSFSAPGQGHWMLLKTTNPAELFIAINLEAGALEIFPKTPQEPNEAARALFRVL